MMSRKRYKHRDLVSGGKMSFFYAFSLLFAGLYLFGHINQLQGTIIRPGSGYFNIVNLLLCALGVFEAVFPLLIVLGRDRWLKLDLYLISAMYIVGNLWFIRWIISIISTGDVSFDFAAYQLRWFNMFNHTSWASRNAETLLLNYLNAYFWLGIARNIDRDKNKTCANMVGVMVVTFVLPIVFFAATRFKMISEWWIEKSITLFVSYFCIIVMMFIAASKKNFWTRYICGLKKSEIQDSEKKEEQKNAKSSKKK